MAASNLPRNPIPNDQSSVKLRLNYSALPLTLTNITYTGGAMTVRNARSDLFFVDLFQQLSPDVAASFTNAQLDAVKRAFAVRSRSKHPINIRLSLPGLRRRYYLVVLAGKERRSTEQRWAESAITQGQPVVPLDAFTTQFFRRIPAEVAATFNDAQLTALKSLFGHIPWRRHAIDQRRSVALGNRRYYLVVVAGRERRSPLRRTLDRRLHPLWTLPNSMAMAIAAFPLFFGVGLGAGALIHQPNLVGNLLSPITVGGVPVPILLKAFEDESVRQAYWSGDKQGLHDRLNAMGIEEDIKDYYRPHASGETDLDQKIHQIFYNQTGYVGDAYQVDETGRLQPQR